MKDRDKLSHNHFAQVKEPDEQLSVFVLPELDPGENADNNLTTFKALH
jgi:hypothetical protein